MWRQHERGPRAQPFFEKAEAYAADKPFLNDADMLTQPFLSFTQWLRFTHPGGSTGGASGYRGEP